MGLGASVYCDKILCNGIHAGDRLDRVQVDVLAAELNTLHDIHLEDDRDEEFLRQFEQQLCELVECAQRVNKPIVF
jgi:hypothetical protein